MSAVGRSQKLQRYLNIDKQQQMQKANRAPLIYLGNARLSVGAAPPIGHHWRPFYHSLFLMSYHAGERDFVNIFRMRAMTMA